MKQFISYLLTFRPHVKKGFPSQPILNKHLSHKRKLEDLGTEQRKQNWQYTSARVEPVHRFEIPDILILILNENKNNLELKMESGWWI